MPTPGAWACSMDGMDGTIPISIAIVSDLITTRGTDGMIRGITAHGMVTIHGTMTMDGAILTMVGVVGTVLHITPTTHVLYIPVPLDITIEATIVRAVVATLTDKVPIPERIPFTTTVAMPPLDQGTNPPTTSTAKLTPHSAHSPRRLLEASVVELRLEEALPLEETVVPSEVHVWADADKFHFISNLKEKQS